MAAVAQYDHLSGVVECLESTFEVTVSFVHSLASKGNWLGPLRRCNTGGIFSKSHNKTGSADNADYVSQQGFLCTHLPRTRHVRMKSVNAHERDLT